MYVHLFLTVLSSFYATSDFVVFNSYQINIEFLKVMQVLTGRVHSDISVICDPDAGSLCGSVIFTLQSKTQLALRIFETDYNRREIFSAINVLCFRKDRNLLSFSRHKKESWRADDYNIFLVNKEPDLDRIQQAQCRWVNSKFQHTILIYESCVYGININGVHRLLTDNVTNIRSLFGTRNFNGYALKVTLFPRVPEVIKTEDGYIGANYNMMVILAKHMNFTPIILNSSDGKKFGEYVNGTYTGGLGDVVYGRSDIAMNGFFLKDVSYPKFKYSFPVNFEHICIVVPKAKRMPKYLTPFLCFPFDVWIAVIVTFLSVTGFRYILSCLGYKFLNFDKVVTNNIILTTFSAAINYPLSTSQYRYRTIRIVLIAYFSIMYIMVSSFRASLVTLLSIPKYYKDPNTLEDIKAENMEIRTSSKYIIKTFKHDESFAKINQHVKMGDIDDFHNLNFSFFSRFLYSQRKQFNDFMIRRDNRVYAFRRVPECPLKYYTAYVLPVNFPFTDELNVLIMKVVESGLIAKWDTEILQQPLSDESFQFMLADSRVSGTDMDLYSVAFSLEHLEIAFLILVGGWVMSILVLLFEISTHTRNWLGCEVRARVVWRKDKLRRRKEIQVSWTNM